jgi:hypothetical protein
LSKFHGLGGLTELTTELCQEQVIDSGRIKKAAARIPEEKTQECQLSEPFCAAPRKRLSESIDRIPGTEIAHFPEFGHNADPKENYEDD